MKTKLSQHLVFAVLCSLAPCTAVLAQGMTDAHAANPGTFAAQDATKTSFDRAVKEENNWYFSWGYR